MSNPQLVSRIDEALAAVVALRTSDIEAAELTLREARNLLPDVTVLAKLKQLRAAAANAAHLWSGYLPEAGTVTYSLDGQVTTMAVRSELSVTG